VKIDHIASIPFAAAAYWILSNTPIAPETKWLPFGAIEVVKKPVVGIAGIQRLESRLVISLALTVYSVPASAGMNRVVTFLLDTCSGGGTSVEVDGLQIAMLRLR
jgi:hypothetical protein